jgi:hypothetical protein
LERTHELLDLPSKSLIDRLHGNRAIRTSAAPEQPDVQDISRECTERESDLKRRRQEDGLRSPVDSKHNVERTPGRCVVNLQPAFPRG